MTVLAGDIPEARVRSWTSLIIAAAMALSSREACSSMGGRTVLGELLDTDRSSKPYWAPYIVLAVVDSCEWRPAAESAMGANRSLFNTGNGEGEARFLRFRPILAVRGTIPATPFWADAAFVRYPNGLCMDIGDAICISVGDTVVTSASERYFLSGYSTAIVENGLLGGQPVLEVINAYQERVKDEEH